MSNQYRPNDSVTIKLTEWELGNLHLPPVATVTLYEGDAPVKFLRNRIAMILEKNQWLTSRIVKKNAEDGKVALEYTKNFKLASTIDQHFTVYEAGDVGLSLNKPYEELLHCLLPVQCARSKPATDKDEPLFKVAIVPIETEETNERPTTPLQHALALPGLP
jgi:hypothetical protein